MAPGCSDPLMTSRSFDNWWSDLSNVLRGKEPYRTHALVQVSRWYKRDGFTQEPCHHRNPDAPLIEQRHGTCMSLQK